MPPLHHHHAAIVRPPPPSLPMYRPRRLGGGEIEVKRRASTRKSVSVSCSCRACGRGEAA
eukprot:13060680-Alexandrium_andersonii.AAC.1